MFGRRRELKTHGELLRGELGKGIDHLRHAAGYAARTVGATVRPTLASVQVKVTPSVARVRTAAAQGWGSAAAVALLPLMAAARRSASKAHRRKNALEAGNFATMARLTRTGKAAGRGKAPVIGKKGPSMSGKRSGLLVGLLAVGAAAGVAGALMSRRRIRAQWDEHESPAVDAITGDVPPVLDATKSPEDASPDMVAVRLATSSDEATEPASSSTDAANNPASKQSKAAGKAGTGAEPPAATLTFGEPKDTTDQLAKGAATRSKASSRG